MEIVSMTCRNCGGKLEISKDSEQILCLHCGTEYLVSYKDSGVSLRLLSEGIKRIQESTDKTAAELALARIRAEKENLRHVIKTRVWDRMKYEDLTIYTVNEVGEPSSLHKILEKVLHDMEASSFPFREPKSKIEKVKQYLDISAELVAKYDEANIIVPVGPCPATMDKAAVGIFLGTTRRLDHIIQRDKFCNYQFSHVFLRQFQQFTHKIGQFLSIL